MIFFFSSSSYALEFTSSYKEKITEVNRFLAQISLNVTRGSSGLVDILSEVLKKNRILSISSVYKRKEIFQAELEAQFVVVICCEQDGPWPEAKKNLRTVYSEVHLPDRAFVILQVEKNELKKNPAEPLEHLLKGTKDLVKRVLDVTILNQESLGWKANKVVDNLPRSDMFEGKPLSAPSMGPQLKVQRNLPIFSTPSVSS